MALPVPTPTAEDLRKAIIARLGIDPTRLTGFGGDPEFDAKVEDLYRKSTKGLGDLDLAQSRLGSDYEFDLSNSAYDQKRALLGMENTLADRGLIRSGIAVSQRADLERNFANQLQALNTRKTRSLEDIGSQKNEIINSLLAGRGTYEGEYANNLAEFLQGQAQASAQGVLAKPVATPAAVQRRVSRPASVVVKPVVPLKPEQKVSTSGTPYAAHNKPVGRGVNYI